ncbi:hypothetical protein [Streptomyces sp. NPDC093707]
MPVQADTAKARGTSDDMKALSSDNQRRMQHAHLRIVRPHLD